MKGRSLLLLGASLILGVLAIMLFKSLAPTPQASAAIETRDVVVAATVLNFGDPITAKSLKIVKYLPDAVPENSFSKIDDLVSGEPRVSLATIQPGEPILAAKVSGKGGKASLSAVVDPTKRAVTIRVNDVSGTAGFIMPKDRVDVMLTRSDGGNKQAVTDVLLQNIKVLAIDQLANEQKDTPMVAKAITLEVTPDDAEKIALAETIGTLSLALRNLSNATPVATRPISTGDLVGDPPRKAADKHVIELLRGSKAEPYEVGH